MLQAEATAQAAVAAGARSQDSAHHGDKRAAGSADGGSPTVCLNGDSASASPLSPWQGALRGGDGSPAVKLPWKSAKQLMELFPSFKAFQRERAPMEVMQRDEIGLLSSLDLYGGSPTSSLDHEEALQQQQGQQALDCSCSHPCSARSGAASEAVAAAEQLALQYGRSPDSDDCSEQTGRQLMHAFCDSGDSGPASSSRALPGADDSEAAPAEGPPAPCGLREAALAAAAAAERQEQQAQARQQAAPPRHHSQQRAACVHHEQRQAPLQQRQQPAWQQPHTTASTEEAYSQAKHAQVAALLGQPVYDPALSGLHASGRAGSTGVCLPSGPGAVPTVVPSSSKPHRSPFMSDLLHHTHPPGPQEQSSSAASGAQRSVFGSCAAAALGGTAGSASPASLSGCSEPSGHRGESFWVSQEEEAAALEVAAQAGTPGAFCSLPFSVRNAPLLRVIPKYYGTAPHADGRTLLELEDLASAYRHPCIIDIKIGFRTWYPEADPAYIQRCRKKDASTTQAALGFKICGMQVFRHGAGGYWRASKRWCKTLPAELVDKALHSFAHNDHGLRPSDVYGGPGGAIAQLEALESWFAVQRDFRFYSSSVLVLYEGGAASPEGAKVRVRLVDFAHTFFQGEPCSPRAATTENGAAAASRRGPSPGGASPPAHPQQQPQRRRDTNFLAGLRALLARLRAVVHAQLQAELT